MNHKHKDTGHPLFAHRDEVLALFGHCGNSFAAQVAGRLHWWKARFCCAHKWLHARKLFTKIPVRDMISLKVACPTSARASALPVKAEPQKLPRHAFDPHFGIPLRLAVNTRLGVVWAYSTRHLVELKAYVLTTLREHTRGNITRSLLARLPVWIKPARNRNSVLQSISRLEQKLLSAG